MALPVLCKMEAQACAICNLQTLPCHIGTEGAADLRNVSDQTRYRVLTKPHDLSQVTCFTCNTEPSQHCVLSEACLLNFSIHSIIISIVCWLLLLP